MNNRFKQRTGCFNCGDCNRKTREGKQATKHLCPQCDERASIENGLNDGGYESDEEIHGAKMRVNELAQEAIDLGGSLRDISNRNRQAPDCRFFAQELLLEMAS